jgi:hypothetical protein
MSLRISLLREKFVGTTQALSTIIKIGESVDSPLDIFGDGIGKMGRYFNGGRASAAPTKFLMMCVQNRVIGCPVGARLARPMNFQIGSKQV